MSAADALGSGPPPAAKGHQAVTGSNDTREISRIWQGFMTARFTLGLVLLVLQGTLYATGTPQNKWLIAITLAYFASTLTTGLFGQPRFLGSTFNRAWILLVGLDVIAFTSLQFLQKNTINYTPLFALPILLASVLGSLQLALGTAAGVTMLLLGGTLWTHVGSTNDSATFLAQAALSGAGYFAIALLANQLSTRLASEGMRARSNQAAANVQRQINALVIESLPDGVLIVDADLTVRSANPAARAFMERQSDPSGPILSLTQEAAWNDLVLLTRKSLSQGVGQEASVSINFDGQGPRRVRVRTRITDAQDMGGEILCVLFLQDQRELEARMRTERLASMGRMSTAVAHEIRNPLAAISQANALLDEELVDVHQKNLTRMVRHNAQRLAKIVDDILNASNLQQPHGKLTPLLLSLNDAVVRCCRDWSGQHFAETDPANPGLLAVHLEESRQALDVHFDGDHLRRILVNLLDNAKRYASGRAGSIQVHTAAAGLRQARLAVWSDGAPMDQGVERHLFEPFFSSESRSTGLGLYICRELCEGHGAQIGYQRTRRMLDEVATEGNEFVITMGTIER
jgi:two-component system sensor histidine kinase PilS (NtrC family)